jgi:hypothetical protein
VYNRITEPITPPIKLVKHRTKNCCFGIFKLCLYALALAIEAIHKAVLLLALAFIGATPRNIRVGNVIKLPPPATAFNAPATNAVVNNRKL